jgi:hypothetical protein
LRWGWRFCRGFVIVIFIFVIIIVIVILLLRSFRAVCCCRYLCGRDPVELRPVHACWH